MLIPTVRVQTFSVTRLGPRRWKSTWSDGGTFFHRTFKEAVQRHNDLAGRLSGNSLMVASFVDCPKVKLEVK